MHDDKIDNFPWTHSPATQSPQKIKVCQSKWFIWLTHALTGFYIVFARCTPRHVEWLLGWIFCTDLLFLHSSGIRICARNSVMTGGNQFKKLAMRRKWWREKRVRNVWHIFAPTVALAVCPTIRRHSHFRFQVGSSLPQSISCKRRHTIGHLFQTFSIFLENFPKNANDRLWNRGVKNDPTSTFYIEQFNRISQADSR